jgi:hypothetical protein
LFVIYVLAAELLKEVAEYLLLLLCGKVLIHDPQVDSGLDCNVELLDSVRCENQNTLVILQYA